jgi:type I restriction enzyme R subunit
MQSQGLENKPEAVANLKGDAARAQFINLFKEVQRLNTQLDQYTDLTPDNKTSIELILPKDQLQGFKGVYIDTAQRLKEKQDTGGDKTDPAVQQLDFEFVLFASSIIDYDYIMALIARYSSQTPGKQKVSREQLIGLIQADAKFIDERDDIAEYINTLEAGKALDEKAIRAGFDNFKSEKHAKALADIAARHSLGATALQAFVEAILRRMVFDGDQLSELFTPLELGWKARTKAELTLMEDLIPVLKKLAQGREISGLGAYEQ